MAFSLEDAVLLVLLVGYATYWVYDLRKGIAVRRLSLGLHIFVYCPLGFWILVTGAIAFGIGGRSRSWRAR